MIKMERKGGTGARGSMLCWVGKYEKKRKLSLYGLCFGLVGLEWNGMMNDR